MKRAMMIFAAFLAVALVALSVSAGPQKGMTLPKDWESYHHIGSLVITDKSHGLYGIHHFYINNKGLDAFKKGKTYPDGTIIVDSVYDIQQDGAILNEGKRAFLPVMKRNSKMTETGGWEWYAFSPDGKMLDKDPKKDCFSCHEPKKDSQYVFSKPLK